MAYKTSEQTLEILLHQIDGMATELQDMRSTVVALLHQRKMQQRESVALTNDKRSFACSVSGKSLPRLYLYRSVP